MQEKRIRESVWDEKRAELSRGQCKRRSDRKVSRERKEESGRYDIKRDERRREEENKIECNQRSGGWCIVSFLSLVHSPHTCICIYVLTCNSGRLFELVCMSSSYLSIFIANFPVSMYSCAGVQESAKRLDQFSSVIESVVSECV